MIQYGHYIIIILPSGQRCIYIGKGNHIYTANMQDLKPLAPPRLRRSKETRNVMGEASH